MCSAPAQQGEISSSLSLGEGEGDAGPGQSRTDRARCGAALARLGVRRRTPSLGGNQAHFQATPHPEDRPKEHHADRQTDR